MTLVCPHCFKEQGLKRRIEEMRPGFPNRKCTFHPRYKGVPIEEITSIIDPVFKNNFGIGEYNPHNGEQKGDPLEVIVAELTQAADDEINLATVNQLIDDDGYWPPDGGEPFYEDAQNYVRYRPNDFHHSDLWRNFCDAIVHDQRFFNTDAKELIAEIFDGLHLQRDIKKQSPVYEIKPGDPKASFFRARIANDETVQEEIKKSPTDNLGPPPRRKRRAGRMNPAGVAALYGAFDIRTCVAELRPVVGSIVMSGQFHLLRPIYVLDTTRFQSPVKETSMFSKDHIRRVQQWQFMRSFMHEIAEPIFPHDEHIDYIPTQAVAEYLLYHHAFKRHGNPSMIEGIIYKSAQNPTGKNIVLLGAAANIETPTIKSTKSKGNTEFREFLPESMATFMNEKMPTQSPALMFDESSIRRLKVESAQYETIISAEHNNEFDHENF